LASLILVVNVVGELQRKRTLAASRGFLAAARLSCVLFLKLMERKIPVSLLQVLVHWYSLNTAVVKWQSVCSYVFQCILVSDGVAFCPLCYSVFM